jgi:multidrug efflux system membrane fusion protein
MDQSKPPGNRARNGARLALLAAVVAAAGAAGWWAWRQQPTSDTQPGAMGAASGAASAPGAGGRRFGGGSRVQPVTVAVVRRQDMRVVHAAIGNIAALNTAVVRARIDGELKAIRFKEGQDVRAGQLLAEIDPRPYEVQLAQAQGQLVRDQAQLRNAQLDLDRYQGLLSRDAIARQQVDTQEALVRQLQGTLQVDAAAVDSAKLMLSYTRVVAPISGKLGLKLADLGNVVRASDAAGIVTITQTQPISVVFAVPEALLPRVLGKLKSGEPPVVEAWDREQRARLAVGNISTTDNAIDTVTGTLKIKAEFANTDGSLFPNQFVNIRLQVDTIADALAVPTTAVQRGARGNFVYVVREDSTVTVRGVRPGAVDGDWTSVQGELSPGEKVVTDGADRLREGAKVEVITPPPPRGAGPGGGERARAGDKARRGASAASATVPSAPVDAPAAASRVPDAPPAARTAKAAASAKGGGAPAGAPAAAAAAEERPPWLDRLPPDVQERFLKMNPEQRKEFIEKLRERRRQRESGG